MRHLIGPGLVIALGSACVDATPSSTNVLVPGSRAYEGASCGDENEPGRICANPVDRCPSGGFYPSRMACRLGTWRCLRDPVGSCGASMTPPEMPQCTNEGERGASCDLGLCPDGTPVQAHRVCLNGRHTCQPDLPVCASAAPHDAGTAVDASIEYHGPCQPGETRHCYSGPIDSEGIGQCHGSTQACVVDERTHNTNWSADCIGEVTQNPVETPYDGIDNDCNGWVDDDQRLHTGHVWNCISNRGCFWFDNPPERPWSTDIYGFQGCMTSGHFLPFDGTIRPGMLISNGRQRDLHWVYYVATNGRRYYFPTATTLASWFLEPGGTGDIRLDSQVCRRVIEVSDEVLAMIPFGGNMTIRPGTVTIGTFGRSSRYVISRGGILRQLFPSTLSVRLVPDWLTNRDVITPDVFFTNYAVGASLMNPSDYDARREYETTIEENLGITAP